MPVTREPVELLLRLLLNGGRVHSDGLEYAMSEEGSLCWVDSEGIARKIDCSLASFKQLADHIGKTELWLLCCQQSLNN